MKLKLFIILVLTVFLLFSCTVPHDRHEFENIASESTLTKERNQRSYLWDKYYYGSSYYPEWWEKKRWEKDFQKMSDLGFNCVRMGEFAWALLEPEEGRFDFAWMDTAIAIAANHGIHVFLCTPTAALPPWLLKKYPSILSGNAIGKFDFGERRGYSTESPEMLKATKRIVTAMAKHFGMNNNVVGWQLDNEPGSPLWVKDRYTESSFRKWLEKKYGSVDKLNDAWFGAFWSLHYSCWEEIEIPLNLPAGHDGGGHPSQILDYRCFFSDSYKNFLTLQANLIREYSRNKPVFTNWPNPTSWSIDVYDVASVMDATAWDNYAQDPGISDFHEQYYSGMSHDLCRNAGPNGHFIITEQSTQPLPITLPGKIRLQTYINLAHGANGTIYFQWRSPLGGSERGYTSILQYDGSFGIAEQEYRDLGKELPVVWKTIKNSRVDADLAILFSFRNGWNYKLRSGEPDRYEWEVQRYYRGLKGLHRNFDVINMTTDFSNYKLIAAPNLRIVSDELANKLIQYVKHGGILVLNKGAGVFDETNCYREALPPSVFSAVAGIKIPYKIHVNEKSRHEGMDVNEAYQVKYIGAKDSYNVLSCMEWIQCITADTIAIFKGGRMEGAPAITINSFGKGHVIYVGTDSREYGLYDELAKFIRTRFEIAPLLEVPIDVEVVSRETNEMVYLFLLNLSENTYEISLPHPMKEMIEGNVVKDTVYLGALGVKILEKPI